MIKDSFHKIAILVLNWNGLDDTIQCLLSLQKINYTNYKVIVIDNASCSNDVEILKKGFGNKIYFIKNKKNYGFAEGNNIGIRYAIKNNFDYIVCLNNDTIVEKNFLSELAKKADLNKNVGMVASLMLDYKNRNKIDNMGLQMTKSGLAFNIVNNINKKCLFVPCAGAALYKVSMLKKLQFNNDFFDSDFFMYAEDVDIGFRAVLLGYTCELAEKAVVYHKGGASSGHLSDFHVYYNQRNILYCIFKNFPLYFLFKYSLWIFFLQCGLFLISVKRLKLLSFLRADFDFLKNIGRLLSKRKTIQKNIKITNKELEKKITPKVFIWSYFFNSLKK